MASDFVNLEDHGPNARGPQEPKVQHRLAILEDHFLDVLRSVVTHVSRTSQSYHPVPVDFDVRSCTKKLIPLGGVVMTPSVHSRLHLAVARLPACTRVDHFGLCRDKLCVLVH